MQESTEPPMGDSLDSTFGFRRLKRKIRNWLLIGFILVSLIDVYGTPHLRWEYRYEGNSHRPIISDATYVGFNGRLEVHAGQYGAECPLLLLIKPEPSLTRQLAGQIIFLLP